MTTTTERIFFTTKPREIRFETLELYHPQIGLLRYVKDQQFEKQFTLESDAPRNPSETVTFSPASMRFAQENQDESQRTSIRINLGAVGQEVKSHLKKLNGDGYLTLIEGIYRTYKQSDTSQPMNIPVKLVASSVSMEGQSVSILLEDDNPEGVSVARKQLAQDFPGLEVSLG